MKIRVQHRNGVMETISIVDPCQIHEGDSLSHLTSAEGMDHYFTSDGYYDGWGMGTSVETMEEAAQAIEQIEGDREIDGEQPGKKSA
jgi:hypothetical protein